MSVHIQQISKNFGRFPALRSIDLDIPTGELVALLGPSGSGKTTLLRILAGLEIPDSGTVLFEQTDVTNQSPRDRKIGMVFQHYALFRNMSVADNIGFGLRVLARKDRPSAAEAKQKVNELIHLVQLEGLASRYPSQLSGGQRQRVGLARALATDPKVLLLDEPFGALDAQVRKELRAWLKNLHKRLHVTSIFVTHDQEEALEIADRIVVLHQGQIQQVGPPAEVYNAPKTPFVARFLGNVSLLKGDANRGQIRVENVPLTSSAQIADGEVSVYIRPHDIEIVTVDADKIAVLPAELTGIDAVGGLLRISASTNGGQALHLEMPALAARERPVEVGQKVLLKLHSPHVFSASTEG